MSCLKHWYDLTSLFPFVYHFYLVDNFIQMVMENVLSQTFQDLISLRDTKIVLSKLFNQFT